MYRLLWESIANLYQNIIFNIIFPKIMIENKNNLNFYLPTFNVNNVTLKIVYLAVKG